MKRWMACLPVSALLVILDQAVKRLAVAQRDIWLAGNGPKIPGIIGLTYTENTGAAFGMLSSARWLLVALSAVASIVIVWAIIKSYFGTWQADWMLTVILAGALGNAIDRAFTGYVVDYLRFLFIDFAIFNIADICIVCGGILFVLYMLLSQKSAAKPAKEASDALDGDGTA